MSYLLLQINCTFLEDVTIFYVPFIFLTVSVDLLIDNRVVVIFIVKLTVGI